MNPFKDPDFLHQDAFKKQIPFEKIAPWDNNSTKSLSTEDLALSSADKESLAIKSRLSRVYIINILSLVIGNVFFVAGIFSIFLYMDKDEFLHSLALPLYITAIFIIVGIILLYVNAHYKKKTSEMIKHDLMQSYLNKWFTINDYIFNNQKTKPDKFLFAFLLYLKIADNAWNQFLYTDYFKGNLQNTQFIFIDCSLPQFNLNVPFMTFKGQIILIQLNQFPTDQDFCMRTFIEKSSADSQKPLDFFIHPQLNEQADALFNPNIHTEDVPSFDLINTNVKHPVYNNEVSIDNPVRKLLLTHESVFYDIQRLASCDTGFILSNKFLIILLVNEYDPFEFNMKDLFKSYDQLANKIDAQAGWIWSIIKEVEKTGWI